MRKRKDLRSTVTLAGAHRGAEYLLDPFVEWERQTSPGALVRVIDPRPERISAFSEKASARGLATEGIALRLEELLAQAPLEDRVLVLTLDTPGAVARALSLTHSAKVTLLGYLLLRLPSGLLWGMRMIFLPEDATARRQAERFFDLLSRLTSPGGSGEIIGAGGAPEHLAIEGLLRSWMGSHLKDNLGKVMAGLPVTAYPIEVTDDGDSGVPLLLIEEENGSTKHSTQSLIEGLGMPLPAGKAFMVAYLSAGSIRFTRVHLPSGGVRLSDRQLALFSDKPSLGATPHEQELTIATLTTPVAMTD